MTYQVLARKWRPKSFDTLIGQEHVVRALRNALDNQRLHHAYLLTGTRGVGKTTIARIMGKALNCETGVTSRPCGVCDACVQIDSGRFVDLLEIDAASNTGIDNIREVLENAQYAPTAGRFKIYIIDEVHMLSRSAFNAMLKTLEEPPPHVKFILATTDPQKVPVTVLSRCLQFSLKQMTPQLIAHHLAHVLDTEQIGYEASALTLLGHAAAGSMRDALSLLDQAIAYGAGKVEEEGIRAMLGAVDQRYIFDLLDALHAHDGKALIHLIEELRAKAIAFDAALSELLHILHQVALAQVVPGAIDEDTPYQNEILAVARSLDPESVQLYYQIALYGRKDLPLAVDEYAGFSMALLRMLAFAPVDSAPVTRPLVSSPQPLQQDGATPATQPHSPARIAPLSEAVPVSQESTIAAVDDSAPSPVAEIADDKSRPEVKAALADFRLQDWAGLAQGLKGMSMMLAQNSALVSVQGNVFNLRVASKDQIVAERMYQDKLRADLSDYFGEAIIVKVDIASEVNDTPLIAKEQKRSRLQAEAETVIQQDTFVQNLITEFGATITPGSIKPIE